MRSRRSSSRGRAIRSQSTSSSDTSSTDFSHGHYPNTRSKRGRARLAGQAHPFHGSQPHDVVSPSQPTSQPLATPDSTPTAQISLRQTTHRDEFQFTCTMDKPVITAFITVTLQEEAAISTTSGAPVQQNPQDKDDSKNERALLGMESAGKIGQRDDTKEKLHDEAGKTTCAATEDDDGSSGEYRCLIEEEPPSSANDK